MKLKLWPLPTSVAFIILSVLLPTESYINRGFTKWFHLVSLLYLLTQSKFLAKFQTLSGTGICLGWYATLLYDYFVYGKFFHVLYRNMPAVLTDVMVQTVPDDEFYYKIDFETPKSLGMIVLSHILDTLGHPLLTWYFWRRHKHQFGGNFDNLVTWKVILATWLFSRSWSLTHSYYNSGTFRMFYMGYDVYRIDSLDLWYPAYIVESILYLSIILWKFSRKYHSKGKTIESNDSNHTTKPTLQWSDSSLSQEDDTVISSRILSEANVNIRVTRSGRSYSMM